MPPSMVEVPVIIDDNGTIYKTKFIAGNLFASLENNNISPVLDWMLVGIFF